MSYSLLNPNQLRAAGVSLCNDPTDPHRAFGMTDPDDQLFVPFKMKGTIACFDSHVPSDEEIQN